MSKMPILETMPKERFYAKYLLSTLENMELKILVVVVFMFLAIVSFMALFWGQYLGSDNLQATANIGIFASVAYLVFFYFEIRKDETKEKNKLFEQYIFSGMKDLTTKKED